MTKKVVSTQKTNATHWVGDGFHVKTLFSYNDLGREISPFLLMDFAAQKTFDPNPSAIRRGVGSHPHRGFETVTIVYQGQVEHRDSAGGGGVIQDGDVQWMAAGSGLVHEEKHGVEFSRLGGPFEMVQLWVNLPKIHKMTKPRYQGIKSSVIPKVDFPNGAGFLRVIAGSFTSVRGPAKTFSPIDLWDMRLHSGANLEFKVPPNNSCVVFVLSGQIRLAGSHTIGAAELAVLNRSEDGVQILAEMDSKVLFLGGEPFDEPVVGQGPFVMNTKEEIYQAIADFSAGKMGTIENIEGSE